MSVMMIEEPKNPNPLQRASFINKLCFWWLKNIFYYGSKNDLEIEDLYDTLPKDQTDILGTNLERAWKDELKRKNYNESSLTRVLIRVYRWKFFKYSLLTIFSYILQVLQPLLLKLVMSYFHRYTETDITEAYLYVTISVIFMATHILVKRYCAFRLMLIGMQIKTSVSSLIYKKLIRLSSSSASASTGSSIANLLTNDVSQFETICYSLPYLVIVPLQLIFCTGVICDQVGYLAGLFGVVLLIVQTLPIQGIMYYATLKIRPKLSSRSDIRISLLNEIINGIRTIKMYVWENYFEKLVQITRRKEIQYYLKISYITSIVIAVENFAQRFCTFIILLICMLRDDIINGDRIIPVSQYLSIVAENIGGFFFHSVEGLAYVKVSIKRIQKFLLCEEKGYNNVEKLDAGNLQSIIFNEIKASWNSERIKPTLDSVNFEVAVNDLCIIVGSVGSGKSTLLKLILGEIIPISGKVYVQGRISYASQVPWLFPASVRENIIFGEKFDEKWYGRVIKACALDDDFEQLPYGDKTLVGDRGITLSGGQRARINLARSVYRKADIYLLDDQFSAVDARVAELIFNNCVDGLLKDKTRVLVTNNYQYLHKADKIILLKQGKIEYVGNFVDFRGKAIYSSQQALLELSETEPERKVSNSNELTPLSVEYHEADQIDEEPEEIEEITAKGKISASLCWRYIQASRSYLTLTVSIVSTIIVTISIAGFDYYLAHATSMEELSEALNSTIQNVVIKPIIWEEFKDSLYIFASISVIVAASSILKNISFYKLAFNASKNIHNAMFTRILGTPLRFFETNPSGRILNRFSEDMRCVDNLFPMELFFAITGISTISAMMIPVLIINIWIGLPMLVILYLYYKLSIMYIRTAQGVKRLEGIARSPVLSFATSSFAGAVTIRSCQVESLVCEDFDSRQDSYMKPYFLVTAVSQAFCCWVEMLLTVLFAILAYSCVIFKSDNDFAAFIGLSLMQVLGITSILSDTVLYIAQMLVRLVNVERMFQFTELDQEGQKGDRIIQKKSDTWPDSGEIEFDHLNLRYSDDGEPVLKDLNFIIESRSKVGIVGRTGAGKSSLISALFHLTDIDGSLTIDGLDIKNISLPDLRSKISIIPQEPTLFSASLRDNLDPLKEYDDATLWSALEDVELKRTFDTLDHPINERGSNLSSGQRQLLCLARAIIRKNKIVIMDEATANIDLTTDEFIQKTIRSKFNDCTVLTIAHRLNTIIDSDKVLVMDNGRVIEYDHPHLLLQDNDSFFTNLVQKTGHSSSENLKNIAKQVYEESLKKNL